jgi:type I restriction enzyme S subunit
VWATCGQLISEIRSGSSAVPKDDPTDFPILRSSSVRPCSVDYKDVRFLTEEDSENGANFLTEGDLLFTRLSGSLDYVGNCALVRGAGFQGIQYPDRLFGAKPISPNLGPYIEIYFAAPIARKQIMNLAKSTAGHQRISIGAITQQSIPLPPLSEQQRIAAEVERRLSVVEELEAAIEANMKRAGRLRQAILRRAFEGRLAPQDPSDEPAEVLLERMRAEREKRGTGGKRREGMRVRQPRLPSM